MGRFPSSVAVCLLGLCGEMVSAQQPAQQPAQLVVGAIRTRAAEPGGIWILHAAQRGAWYRQKVVGTEGLMHNPASLAVDPVDTNLFYVGTYGRDPQGRIGPCNIQRLRISNGVLGERVTLNAAPLDEDYLVAVVPLGDHIYYLGRSNLGRVPRNGGPAEVVFALAPWVDARGMATDGRHLFAIITAHDIVRLDPHNLQSVTLLARNPGAPVEEFRNLAVDREGHVMAVTTSVNGTSHLFRFHYQNGQLLNSVPLPLAGARAVAQDIATGDVLVSGGASDLDSGVVRLRDWQVEQELLSGVSQALPALWVRQPRPFFTHGTGCRDKTGRMPRIAVTGHPTSNGKFTLYLAGPNSQPALLLAGWHAGQTDALLPRHLGPLGAPGCYLDLDKFTAFLGHTDAAGLLAWPVSVPPLSSSTPSQVRMQWLVLAPGANQAGFVVSPSATLVIRSN
ncbi:MAG: hypothetical protein ACYTF5_00745 [Planctomycetota bacterium]